jgi:hypothetical protein
VISVAKLEVKGFGKPEETRKFENGKLDLVKIGGTTIGRVEFQPGWKWSKSIKPLVKTDSCEAQHFMYHLSGTLRIKMDDGTTKDVKAGEISFVPSGHDAWVLGKEPVVVVDFQGYAKA